jgi:hypothetical protein
VGLTEFPPFLPPLAVAGAVAGAVGGALLPSLGGALLPSLVTTAAAGVLTTCLLAGLGGGIIIKYNKLYLDSNHIKKYSCRTYCVF